MIIIEVVMTDNKSDWPVLPECPVCGGALVKSSCSYNDREKKGDVKISSARCLQCSREYDRHTQEYYKVFADDLISDRDLVILKPGLKGKLKGKEYEIIGRLRYQEEEYGKDNRDKWVAVSDDRTYHYFVEQGGRIYSCEEYIPQSIDIESNNENIDFEGKQISRSEA
jgi:hypothetical protein